MKLKSVLALSLALGLGYVATDQVSQSSQPTTAYAQKLKTKATWHNGTPKALRKLWQGPYSKAHKAQYQFEVTAKTFTALGYMGTYCTNVHYQYLGSHVYALRGDGLLTGKTTRYVRYYSKHKVRIGTSLKTSSSKWTLYTHK